MNWSKEIPEVLGSLGSSGLVLLPTDSVWGLCCDASDPVALHRVLKLKQERPGVGMVCLVSDLPMLKRFVPSVHPRIETMLAYVKRPVTVLYEGVTGLPDIIKGPRGEVAIRLTQDRGMAQLVERFGRPLVATLPILGGSAFDGRFSSIHATLVDRVDHVARTKRDGPTGQVSVILRLNARSELEFVRT